jgi:ornithine cyclodeaminase/alanine dehydrogenase-like protein (mu-crystallin family)
MWIITPDNTSCAQRAVGTFCESGGAPGRDGITVCDFTGLGVEDLYIAEYCYERSAA